jgi:hypothetical protein
MRSTPTRTATAHPAQLVLKKMKSADAIAAPAGATPAACLLASLL